MAHLLFIASDRREAEPWVTRWKGVRPMNLPVHWARAGKWNGRDVIAVANGVGSVHAIAAVKTVKESIDSLSGICSIGTGGGLDSSMNIADVVVANSVTDGERTWPACNPGGPPVRSGLVRTSPHIARTAAEKSNLARSGAILVEMEAAGVACTAQEMAVPFYCVRTVSDLASETFLIDFERFLMPDGRFNVPSLVLSALSHPVRGFGELLQLQRRTSAAANRLGEFLAKCNF